jgi:hypothetical protein
MTGRGRKRQIGRLACRLSAKHDDSVGKRYGHDRVMRHLDSGKSSFFDDAQDKHFQIGPQTDIKPAERLIQQLHGVKHTHLHIHRCRHDAIIFTHCHPIMLIVMLDGTLAMIVSSETVDE